MYKSIIRVIFKYEFRHGIAAAQTTQNVNKVFWKPVANERTACRWLDMFLSSDFDLQYESHRWPEIKVDNDKLKAAVEADTIHLKIRVN